MLRFGSFTPSCETGVGGTSTVPLVSIIATGLLETTARLDEDCLARTASYVPWVQSGSWVILVDYGKSTAWAREPKNGQREMGTLKIAVPLLQPFSRGLERRKGMNKHHLQISRGMNHARGGVNCVNALELFL